MFDYNELFNIWKGWPERSSPFPDGGRLVHSKKPKRLPDALAQASGKTSRGARLIVTALSE